MHTLLTLGSALVYFVLAASAVAFVPTLISWGVLRWTGGARVPFNRAYFACLMWTFSAAAAALALLWLGGHRAIDLARPLASPWMRLSLLVDLLLGVFLLWRLVPRGDGHRLRPGEACLGAALSIVPLVLVLALLHR